MFLSWVRWASSLCQIIEFSHDRTVVKWERERRRVLKGVKVLGHFCWDCLCLGVSNICVSNYGVRESSLGQFVRTVAKPLEVDSHVVSWMALILDVQIESL